MATQTVEFFAAPSQTVIAKLFAPGSDTQVASVTATEQTNRKGVYRAVYTDVPAGAYRLLALVGTTPIASWWTDLLLATGLYESYEIALSAITGVIYNAMPGAGWVNGSFGDRMLVSASAQRTVAVTGANHIAADMHESQPNALHSTTFESGSLDTHVRGAVGMAAANFDIQVGNIPAFGDNQRWTSPANQIDVTVTQV